MSQVDPIRCLNGFYMGVKVQNVPSDMERESIFMVHHPTRQNGKSWLYTISARGNCLSRRLSPQCIS